MKTTLIIGSGTSYFSKIPGLTSITDFLLESTAVGRHSDMNYYILGKYGYEKQENLDGYVSSCHRLLKITEVVIDRFYSHLKFQHNVNYEDIYYVLKQIGDSYSMEYENPAIISLIEEIVKAGHWSEKSFRHLIKESIIFIECMVWQLIDKTKVQSNQFNVFKKLISNDELNSVICLNHDLVLDMWLKENHVLFDDGFGYVKDKKLPEWKGFGNQTGILKYCKVHGSVDWFDFRINDEISYQNIVKVPSNFYPERLDEKYDQFLGPTTGRPCLLIGTFNKMLNYLGGIFELLFEELKTTIQNSEVIIISGYGFSDKGINSQLNKWLAQEYSRKMIIIHPNQESLIQKSRGSFKLNVLTDGDKHSKVELIEKPFEEITIEEIINCYS